MKPGNFFLSGKNKLVIANIKKVLVAKGHIYTGYCEDVLSLPKYIQSYKPEIVFIEVGSSFNQMRKTIEVIDREMAVFSIIILEEENESITDFLSNLEFTTYLIIPGYKAIVPQMFNISLSNIRRVLKYRKKIEELQKSFEAYKIVEKAKQVLMSKKGYSEQQAQEYIYKKSVEGKMDMKLVANSILVSR